MWPLEDQRCLHIGTLSLKKVVQMSMLYYKLNGFNDPSLKHVFAASLPSELQRQLTAFNLDIANVSLGKIFQLTMLCLDKICEQKDFFKDLIEQKEPLPQSIKNLTSKSSAKMTKNALVQPTKRNTSRNISINPLPEN